MEQYKKILSNKLFQGSKLSNFQLNTFLDQDNRPLPLGELDVAVSEYEQFLKERNASTCYRLSGILRGVFTNVLFNVTGDKSYETILSLTGDTGKFNPNVTIFQNFGYKDILLEKDGWFFYRKNTSGTRKGCVNEYLRPVPNDFYFLPLATSGTTMIDPNGNPRENWYFKITYPAHSGNCSNIYFQSPYVIGPPGQVNLCDGILITNIGNGTLNGRLATFIETPINHGLASGDQVIIRPFDLLTIPSEKILNVLSVSGTNMFWVDYTDDPLTTFVNASGALNQPLRFKRIFQGIESVYMSRVFRTITTLNDYQLYRAAFSSNIFNDPIQLYHYTLDIDTSPYRDYLNRPLTEVYLTKIKYINPNKFFVDMEDWTLLSVGLITDKPNEFYDVRAIYGGSPNRPLVPPPYIIDFVDENDIEFFGDIVDYNVGNLTERILEVPYYRFNSNNREDNYYGEGYYYRAHDKIKLLDFSSQVEQENLTLPDVNVPDYAVTINGVMQWRDLLTPGFTDAAGNGVDYPFLNGCTYIFTEHELCLYRQNPKQLTIYSATVTNYLGGVGPTNLNFNTNVSNTTVIFALTNSTFTGNTILTNTTYTAIYYGIYKFDYNLTITSGGIPLPIGNVASVDIKIILKDSLGNTKDVFLIGTVSDQLLTSNNGSVNFTASVNILMNVNDYLFVQIDSQGTSIFGAPDFTITFVTVGTIGTNLQVTTNNIPNGTPDQVHYWLAGVNCSGIFGEYLEPVDGKC